MSVTTELLRNEPVQARSAARLSDLLDAAAAAINAVGYERLTTAMVAERAGASIGTVYRYFPDRIAVLHSVALRTRERFTERALASLATQNHSNWWTAIEAIIELEIAAFAKVPAFASLRFGDVLDIRPRENSRTAIGTFVEDLRPHLVSRFGIPDSAELPLRLETAFTLVDALLARAFAFQPRREKSYVDEALRIPRNYLVSIYGEPSSR